MKRRDFNRLVIGAGVSPVLAKSSLAQMSGEELQTTPSTAVAPSIIIKNSPRTYNQINVPRKYTAGRRRFTIYWTWSYPCPTHRTWRRGDERHGSDGVWNRGQNGSAKRVLKTSLMTHMRHQGAQGDLHSSAVQRVRVSDYGNAIENIPKLNDSTVVNFKTDGEILAQVAAPLGPYSVSGRNHHTIVLQQKRSHRNLK